MVVKEWNEEQDRLEQRLQAGEDAIEEVRKMNPKPYRTGWGGAPRITRSIGFTTPIDRDDDVIERDIRLSARQQGKIILGRM